LLNYFQLNLKHEKPIFSSHFSEKTPEYSGVFSRIFVTNIGFYNTGKSKSLGLKYGPRIIVKLLYT